VGKRNHATNSTSAKTVDYSIESAKIAKRQKLKLPVKYVIDYYAPQPYNDMVETRQNVNAVENQPLNFSTSIIKTATEPNTEKH
jgi:hypothetical protein